VKLTISLRKTQILSHKNYTVRALSGAFVGFCLQSKDSLSLYERIGVEQ